MTDHLHLTARVQRALDALPAGALDMALSQIKYGQDEDEQLGVVSQSCIEWLSGSAGKKATNTIGRTRRGERITGLAVACRTDSSATHIPVASPRVTSRDLDETYEFAHSNLLWADTWADRYASHQALDPAELLAVEQSTWQRLAEQRAVTGALVADIDQCAAPATINGDPGLTVAAAAKLSSRHKSRVWITMRLICLAELTGQGVLPGIPRAAEVYRARSLGGI